MRSVATRVVEMRESARIGAVNRVVLLRQLVWQLDMAKEIQSKMSGRSKDLDRVIADAKSELFAAESELLALRRQDA